MRTVIVACVAALLLSACTSDKKPEPQPAPVATGNLCERILPKLTGKWKVADAAPSASVPLSDSCQLIDAEAPQHMVRVLLSVLPVTAEQAVRARNETETTFRKDEFVRKMVKDELGPGSWFVDPPVAAPQIGFRAGDRLVRLRGDTDVGSGFRSDRSTLAELREMAKVILNQPDVVPASQAFVDEPRCAPGGAAAGKALAAKALARRGGTANGLTYCQWASATNTVQVEGGDSSTSPGRWFRGFEPPDPWPATAVKVGDQGWQQADGFLAFRVGNTYVDVYSSTKGSGPAVLELGRAMVPSYPK